MLCPREIPGEYEDAKEGNSTWASGDWTGDCEFNSSDMILAFQSGGYGTGYRTAGPQTVAVPEANGVILSTLGIMSLVVGFRRIGV